MRVIVVGAGILGASTAYHLALAGAEVVVFDQAHRGKATMAGAGIVCPWATAQEDADFYAFYERTGEYYSTLVASLAEHGETDFGYRRVGAMVWAEDASLLDAAEPRIRARAQSSPEAGVVSRLSPQDARALFPPLRDDCEAIHIAGAARVEVRFLAEAMMRVAKAKGTVVQQGHATLVVENGRARGVMVDGVRHDADAVVVTAGAWVGDLLDPLGVKLPVEPQRGQIVHLGLPGVDTSRWPVLLPIGSYYLLAFDDSRVVIGATRETGSGFDYRVTAAGQAEVLNAGLHVAPGLATATVIETKIGFRPYTAAMRPLLGRVAAVEGLIVGNGLGAGGITMGPFAGKLLGELALGAAPSFDLTAYRPAA